jgi:hypothetical protein
VNNKPLMLFCSPRGGSSLVAGVFVRHGFWTGKTYGGRDGRGSGGYVNHENAAIKEFMKKVFPLDAGNHAHEDLPGKAAALRSFCERAVHRSHLWMFKGPSEYYFPITTAFPDAVTVMVFRDPVQAVEAHVRRNGEKVRDIATRVVRKRYAFMEERVKEGAFRVDCERIVDGDLEQIVPVLDCYGIELDHRKAMDGISPHLLHR